MAGIDLIGVPFDGYGRGGNQAVASAALRRHGLGDAFASQGHHVADLGDLDLPPGSGARGAATGMLNEPALLAMVERVGRAVHASVCEGRFPVVHGGDCATLLGTVPALRDQDVGLLFFDGHEDTMPLDVSEDGEAANTEIGLLLGLTGRLLRGALAARLPALRTDQLAMVGQRDEGWRRRFNVASLGALGVWFAPLHVAADDPGGVALDAVAHLRRRSDRWWLHVDLDVLAADELPAQGLPDWEDEPGGMTWAQLSQATTAAIGADGCTGLSVAIYDPDQDPDGSGGRRIIAWIQELAAALRQADAGGGRSPGRPPA